ncbi:MAG: hypothetical protein ACLQFR_10410 [Streptosporangiaceae bacterium]
MAQPRTGQRTRADRRTVRTDTVGPPRDAVQPARPDESWVAPSGDGPAAEAAGLPQPADGRGAAGNDGLPELADGRGTAADDGLPELADGRGAAADDGLPELADGRAAATDDGSPEPGGELVPGAGPLTPGKGQLTEGDGPKVKTPLGELAWSDLDRAVRSAEQWEPGSSARVSQPSARTRQPWARARRRRAHTEPPAAGGLQALLAGDGAAVADGPELVPGEAILLDIRRRVLAWAHRRSLGLSSACGISIALAACAATWLSAGNRTDNFRGVAALGAGYLVLRAGKSLARTADARSPARQSAADSKHWLAALGACLSECAVYAGLAAGAAAEHWPGSWTLAVAVLGLVSVRDMMTACSNPPGLGDRPDGSAQGLARAILTMPAGGRVLIIVLIAPAWGARVALFALLNWAIISVGYGIAGRAIPRLEQDPAQLVRLRDDGAIARTLGALVRGQLMPLPPAILGVAAVATLAGLGLHGLPSVLVASPAIVMLLAAPGSSNRHSGRFDWLVPILLLGAQMMYVAAAGLATRVPGPVIFSLCSALLLWYADLAFPGRPVLLALPRQPGADLVERGTGVGWEGRLLLVGVAAALGVATYAYLALTAYLGLLICAKAVTSGLKAPG